MAVNANPLESCLHLIVQTGEDEKGNPVLKNRNYSRIKSGAVDEDVYAVATSLAGLQKHTLYEVNRTNTIELNEV